jgi:hypothetical protein
MRRLPRVNDSLLVRTDFSNARAWAGVYAEVRRVNEHGFRAYVVPVGDRAFDGAPWQAILAAVPATDMGAAVLFVVDTETLSRPGYPVLAVSLFREDGAPFRCVATELATVEHHLNVDRLSWADLASQVGSDGVFRGWLPGLEYRRTGARVVGGEVGHQAGDRA